MFKSKKKKLEEKINDLEFELSVERQVVVSLRLMYLENLRTLRFSQKANCRYKRHMKKLRGMLDDVGWPRNDRVPEKVVPKKIKLP